MKIKEIRIKNFRGIRHQFQPLEQVNVILGKNASGKTSFIEAARAAITGKMPADAQNIEAISGFVSVDIGGVGLIRREFPESKVLLDGKSTTQKAIGETFKQVFGFSPESAKIATSSEIFGGLSSEDVTKYLLNEGFINVETDIEQLSALCKLSKAAEDELRAHLGEAKNINPAMIDAIYKEFYGQRTSLRKVHKEMEAKARHDGTPARSLEDVTKEFSEVSEALGKATASQKQYADSLKAYENWKNTLELAKKQADAIDCTKPDTALAEKAKAKIEAIVKGIEGYHLTLSTLKANIETLSKVSDSLNTDKCPISDKLKCNTDKTSVMGEIAESLERSNAEYKAIRTKYEELKAKKTASDEWVKMYEANAGLYNEKMLKLKEVETLEKAEVKIPQETGSTEIEALTKKRDALQEQQQAASKRSQAEEAAKNAKTIAAQLATYDEIIEAMNPKKGIRQIMIENSVMPLQEFFDERAGTLLPGRRIIIDTSNGFDIKVKINGNGNPISFSSASASEQARISLILCDMFSELSGTRVLFIDNLDKFDSGTLKALVEYIKGKASKKYETIVLAGVSNTDVVGATSELDALKIEL